uniref:Uncharacterized protein n=1 Tax=Arundo donax TaxID=35708 RepID=A0A0A8Y270_ARUDO
MKLFLLFKVRTCAISLSHDDHLIYGGQIH